MGHPLVEKKIKGIRCWSEWEQMWNAAAYAEQLHGLLHVGFNVITYSNEHLERIRFYLAVASDHGNSDELRHPDEPVHESSDPSGFGWPCRRRDLRMTVARKAFEVLCLNFFRGRDSRGLDADQKSAIAHPKTLQSIISFFLKGNSTSTGLYLENRDGDSDSHFNVIIYTFLDRVIDEILRTSLVEEDIQSAVVKCHISMRSSCVELLYRMQKLDVLLEKKQALDDACMIKLQELTMKKSMFFHRENAMRLPTNVEEAAAFGSKPAQILLILRLRQREVARLDEIYRLEEERAEADRKLKQLQRT